MPKIVIDTTNVSKEEVQKLKDYLEQNCWNWFGDPIDDEVSNKYKVRVCRTAYSHLEIEVEASTSKEAQEKAIDEAGDHVFPSENHSEYSAEGVTIIQ